VAVGAQRLEIQGIVVGVVEIEMMDLKLTRVARDEPASLACGLQVLPVCGHISRLGV
jgi:hypothetical protein